MTDTESNTGPSLWETLARTIVDNMEAFQWDKVILMIQKNLTFDDPGLFSSRLLTEGDKRNQEEASNMWLLNQLLYHLSISNNAKSMQHDVSLQKEILAAAIAKQSWFYHKAIREYISYTKCLQESTVGTEVHAFTVEAFPMATIDPVCIFRKIKISSETKRQQLLESAVRVMTHGMVLGLSLYKELIRDCTDCVLQVFNASALSTRLACLEYFTKLLFTTKEFDNDLMSNAILALEGTCILCEKMPLWLEIDCVTRNQSASFSNCLVQFLKAFRPIRPTTCDLEIFNEIIRLHVYHLRTLSNPKFQEMDITFLELHTIIVKNLTILLSKVGSLPISTNIRELDNIIVYCPEAVRILEFCVLEDFTRSSNSLKATELSATWNNLCRQLYDSLTFIISHFSEYTDDYTPHLKIVAEIIRSTFSLNNSFTLCHQISHISEGTECKLCKSTTSKAIEYNCFEKFPMKTTDLIFFSDGDILSTFQKFIEALMQLTMIGIDDYCLLGDLASNLLKNAIASQWPSIQQIRLIDIIAQSIRDRYDLNLRTVNFEITEVYPETEDNLQLKSVSLLLNLDTQFLSLDATEYLKGILKGIIGKIIANEMGSHFETILVTSLVHLGVRNILPMRFIIEDIVKRLLSQKILHADFYSALKSLLCYAVGGGHVLCKVDGTYYRYTIVCSQCDVSNPCTCPGKCPETEYYLNILKEKKSAVLRRLTSDSYTFNKSQLQPIFTQIETSKTTVDLVNCLPSYLLHLDYNSAWIQLFSCDDAHIRLVFVSQIQSIVKIVLKSTPDIYGPIVDDCVRGLLNAVKRSLDDTNRQAQSSVVNIISKLGTIEEIPQKTLLQLFRMTFFFFIRKESRVSHEAALCAQEICTRHGVTPKNMLNWHKKEMLGLIISLCVSINLRNNIPINNALSFLTKMLGFGGPRDFIAKNYQLMIAMLLPWRLKHAKVERLLEEIASTLQVDLTTCLTSSFLALYLHLFLNDTSEINNKCIEFVITRTGSNLYELLHSDIKKTVAEILIYYHKNPTNVLKAFRCLILMDVESSSSIEMSHSKVAEFIATRFLGVLTFFEACLLDTDFQKDLKEETLLSFGEIMRFIGSTHITPFRFKILAMLRTSLTIEDVRLKEICVDIWKIFVHTIDIQAVGPLLATIVASLEPLLETYPQEVNSIYRYLIISNGSLLSLHIPDVYFIANINVATEIKDFVRLQTDKRRGKSFMEQFEFFLNQINHENPTVRVYGLKYLTRLFSKNRADVNNLIIELNASNEKSFLEGLLHNLIIGCCHNDVTLQLASGKCLGELGAIEPSHLSPNYAPQKSFALSIHTDAFAIMALEELCRAYQFQKDTKYVDSFSLAIQEILSARGVCPKIKKKMEVWEAIPERMRQLMEPLLTSCYTGLKITTNIKIHPVFGSAKCQTAEEWAFIWASKMIEKVQDADTSHLLNSFKPSIKRDANVLSLFLPYIVLHTLQSSDADTREHVYEELQCVIEAAESQPNVTVADFKHTRQRGLKTLHFVPSKTLNKAEEPTEFIGIKCAKIAFEQLDFLERWLRQWRRVYLGTTPDNNFIIVDSFVKRFEKKLIAKANFNCREYARALMYLEGYIEENPSNLLQDNLSFLAEIYAELMNPDSLEGAIGLKKAELNLSEQILVNNMTDRFTESTACFEQLMQYEDIQPSQVNDIIQCYLRLDTPETALLISEGLLNQLGEKYMDDSLRAIQAEPLWRLGRFEELEKLFEVPEINESNTWGVQCGQALLNFRNSDLNIFKEKIHSIRLNALNMLKSGGIEQNSYHKGYHHIMTLHLISEIEKTKLLTEKMCSMSSAAECRKHLDGFFKEWNLRLALLQPIPRVTEPVLCLRRVLLSEMVNLLRKSPNNTSNIETILGPIEDEIARMWVESSELARTAGLFQQAQLCIMNAQKYNPANLFIEKARLLWKKGDQTSCFKVLDQKIEEIRSAAGPSQSIQSLPKATRFLFAEAKFLQATYNAESMNISSEQNIRYFKESLAGNAKSEKCLVHLAQYHDRMFTSMSESEQESPDGRQILLEVMTNYGRSMSYGCEYIYQSMPRMLSVWLDFTSNMRRDDSSIRTVASQMNLIVEKLSNELPLFAFFTAFSQLVSRICHPSQETYTVLKTIIVKLIQKFPQQSLWLILSVFKSSYTGRVKRCTEIFNDSRLSAKLMQKLICDFNSLAEKLIELTNKEIPSNEKNPRVSSLVRHLPKLFATPDFSQIIMPFQEFTQPVLPPISERSNPTSSFDAFPNKCVYMTGIKEAIVVLQSLQRPRKVIILGSDGKDYTIMLKPKDDLRKDYRLMEFNAVVKQYLHQDPDARHRRLGIRTYAVVPLNEECGLIEWVENLQAFRQILMGYYRQRNLGMHARELRNAACAIRDPVEKKREVFQKNLLPRHPPLFAEWFRYRFTTPHNWYQARSSYIKTLAVMSIAGYILGLGDRHGENILFDSTNGDAVHVDFNCLFNKGETFDFPERVPFRLTHNMVNAMGPLGTEGLYRKCCEITMRVLQAQTPTLMSVLRPFVYDPLVSWSRNYRTDGNTERTDAQAMANIKRIEERLKGFVRIKGRTTNIPLSVEGHVNFVIQEATDIDNLAAMYIGWGSYM